MHKLNYSPVIELNRLFQHKNVNVFAKYEGMNPGGSVKERVAWYMIEQAVKRGELNSRKTIIEASSGNMAIALASAGGRMGFDVKIAMSEAMSSERKAIIKALGAKLLLSNKEEGTLGALKKVKEIVKNNPEEYWFVDQFNNPDNYMAHYHGIASEIENCGIEFDTIIAGTGTGGTLMGIAKRFRDKKINSKIKGIIPPGGYKIQGIQNPEKDFRPGILDDHYIDELEEISVEDAKIMSRDLALKEGILAGISSGAVLEGARKTAAKTEKGNILLILADRGEKYLSTNLFASAIKQ